MKTIHKIFTLLLIIGLTGLFNTSAVAQMNEKFRKQAEEKKTEDKTDQDKADNKLDQFKEEAVPAEKKAPAKTQKEEEVEEVVVPDPVFTPQVFTYTHITSVQAKETQLLKKGELKATVADAEIKVKDGREKIAAAREALEKDKKAKKIKEAEYYKKLDKIMKAEKWINDLELDVQKGKELTAE
jgi:hypothetical protein